MTQRRTSLGSLFWIDRFRRDLKRELDQRPLNYESDKLVDLERLYMGEVSRFLDWLLGRVQDPPTLDR